MTDQPTSRNCASRAELADRLERTQFGAHFSTEEINEIIAALRATDPDADLPADTELLQQSDDMRHALELDRQAAVSDPLREAAERVLNECRLNAEEEPDKFRDDLMLLARFALSEIATNNGSINPTAFMIKAAEDFMKEGAYLSHPKVREFLGTSNGDSIEKWNSDYVKELCRAILNATDSTPASASTPLTMNSGGGDLEILRMALGNTAACLGDALATFNRLVGQNVFANSATPDSRRTPE